jgi:hypothetical protein
LRVVVFGSEESEKNAIKKLYIYIQKRAYLAREIGCAVPRVSG